MIILRFFLFTRFGLIITIIGSLIGVFYGWLYMHDQSIITSATNAYNTMQQQIYQKKEEEFVQKTITLSNDAIDIANDVNHQKQDTTNNLKAIERKAIDEAPDEQRPSSVYLKSIITQLNEIYGMKK